MNPEQWTNRSTGYKVQKSGPIGAQAESRLGGPIGAQSMQATVGL